MDGAGVAGAVLPKASFAVTVTEPVVPAVTEAGVPESVSVAAAAGSMTVVEIEAALPTLSVPVRVSR